MTLKEYRQDSERVAKLRAILAMPEMIEALAVVEENGPLTLPVDANALSPTGASVMLGHAKGYSDYPKRLRFLATHLPDPSEFVNPDLQDPEEED